ncbi:hypothetical protein MBUL_01888 [Methylobacterium bullatum]|uniref:Uncharacterized protein n=1 Tax=Methylobacterium bullatum TaxID=570505 RepID=A0A679ITA9_9HYPH|nr:hypothetical protein MBUL_01888 [Methylobacterium bullatum]
MAQDVDEGDDWRSVGTRSQDEAALETARRRAREPDRGRDASRPSDIPQEGWKDILWRVLWALPQDRVLTTAGGVAFFALLAVFPGLVAVVSIYGVFSDPAVISQHVGLLTYILPAAALDLLSEQLVRIAERSTGSLGLTSTISLLIALWSANSGVSALFDALNVIYREREDRTLVRFYATTFLFTLGGAAFLLLTISVVVVLPAIMERFGFQGWADTILSVTRWPVILVVVSFSLSLIYRYGPSRRRAKWRWVSWGSALAAFLWVCTSGIFSWYVASFDSYNRIYGSLGAGIGLMSWMWLSIVVVLLGAEINSEMERQTARDSTEGRPKPLGVRDAFAADNVGPGRD